MSTCRHCSKPIFGRSGVKYAVRHYMHHRCYLDAGKPLADLTAWQVRQFPYQLLKARGLLAEAERLAEPDHDPENIYNLPGIRQSIHETRA